MKIKTKQAEYMIMRFFKNEDEYDEDNLIRFGRRENSPKCNNRIVLTRKPQKEESKYVQLIKNDEGNYL